MSRPRQQMLNDRRTPATRTWLGVALAAALALVGQSIVSADEPEQDSRARLLDRLAVATPDATPALLASLEPLGSAGVEIAATAAFRRPALAQAVVAWLPTRPASDRAGAVLWLWSVRGCADVGERARALLVAMRPTMSVAVEAAVRAVHPTRLLDDALEEMLRAAKDGDVDVATIAWVAGESGRAGRSVLVDSRQGPGRDRLMTRAVEGLRDDPVALLAMLVGALRSTEVPFIVHTVRTLRRDGVALGAADVASAFRALGPLDPSRAGAASLAAAFAVDEPEVADRLRALWASGGPSERDAVVRCLAFAPTGSPAASALLAAALRDDRDQLRAGAVAALRERGSGVEEASVPDVLSVIQTGRDELLRQHAVEVLASSVSRVPGIAPLLAGRVDDPVEGVREQAAVGALRARPVDPVVLRATADGVARQRLGRGFFDALSLLPDERRADLARAVKAHLVRDGGVRPTTVLRFLAALGARAPELRAYAEADLDGAPPDVHRMAETVVGGPSSGR